MVEMFAWLMILAALRVISAKNPVHSVLALVLVFCNATGILILWNVEFLAMVLLIIYVGAISILFLFVVMMLNIKLVETYENQMRFLPIGGMLALVMCLQLYLLLEEPLLTSPIPYKDWSQSNIYHINVLGQVLYTEYGTVFLIAGFVLLLSMIGTLILTKK